MFPAQLPLDASPDQPPESRALISTAALAAPAASAAAPAARVKVASCLPSVPATSADALRTISASARALLTATRSFSGRSTEVVVAAGPKSTSALNAAALKRVPKRSDSPLAENRTAGRAHAPASCPVARRRPPRRESIAAKSRASSVNANVSPDRPKLPASFSRLPPAAISTSAS